MGPLGQVALTPIVNTGSTAIEQFAPVAITGAQVVSSGKNELKEFKVEAFDSYAASDLTYAIGYGFNVCGKIAANQRGAGIFDFTLPIVASCEDVSLGTTDLLVMELGQKYLQKLDNGHGSIFGVFKSVREISDESGWRKHLVVPVDDWFYCELTAALSAPASMIVAATTANAKLLIHNSASGGTLTDGPTCKISNRWKDLELDSGKRLMVRLNSHYGELTIPATECP